LAKIDDRQQPDERTHCQSNEDLMKFVSRMLPSSLGDDTSGDDDDDRDRKTFNMTDVSLILAQNMKTGGGN
jgi:hypothetical protein